MFQNPQHKPAVNNRADGRLQINNLGYIVEFADGLINELSCFIGGRGIFIADGGFTNFGVIAFAAGNTDVFGDIENMPGSMIVTSGFAPTVFFDDVIHNGDEIRTSSGCSTIFFGGLSGAGNFTGTVFMEGGLRPGNSPGIVSFESDLVLSSDSSTESKLAVRIWANLINSISAAIYHSAAPWPLQRLTG